MTNKSNYAGAMVVLFSLVALAPADRPDATKFLPDWTVALVHIPDSVEFSNKMTMSGFAKMLKDDEIQPFVESLYGSAASIVEEIELRLGMTLDQMLQIPAGEIAIAVVAPPALKPEFVIVMDVAADNPDADALLDEGERVLKSAGFSTEKQTEGNTELTVFNGSGNEGPQQIVRFQRENALIITTSLRVAKRLVDNLDGGEKENLTDNPSFLAIKNRCEADGTSSFMWYIDPIRLVRSATKGNVGAQTGLAILPALGLDGLQGIGGNLVFPNDPEIESLSHLHVYMESPRNGILEMITLKNGDSRPENWVPRDLINYITVHMDVQNTYSILKDLYDTFREEGAWGNMVQKNISDNIGIDFEQDVIAEMQGRMTVLQWYQRPPRLGSQSTLVAFKLHRVDRFRPQFDVVMEKFEDNLEARDVAGHEVYTVKFGDGGVDIAVEAGPDADGEEETDRARRRRIQRQARPRPSFAIVDDYLVLADRPAFIEKIIATKNSGDGLTQDEEFKKMASILRRQPGGRAISSLTYSQPKEAIAMLYELLRTDDARIFLEKQREDNEFFRAIDDAMTEHPLPPFSKLEKYLAPSGSIITNEETGIHLMGISLQHKDLRQELEAEAAISP